MLELLLLVFVVYVLVSWLRRRLKIPRLFDRHVLITGCDTGFGYALTKRLDHLGLTVFAGCYTNEGLERVRKTTSNHVHPLRLDVTDHASIQNAKKYVQDLLPAGRGLWGLVNNAGIAGTPAPVEWLTTSHFRQCMEVNLYGMVDMSIEFLPLVRTEGGRIVNMTSVLGKVAFGFSAPYVASKFAAEGFSDVLRRDVYSHGVSVHMVEPGFFRTGILMNLDLDKTYRRLYEGLEQDIKQYYGPNFIPEFLRDYEYYSDKLWSSDIQKVINAYEHALCSRYPRYRYLVGFDANTYIWLLSVLPEFISDFVFSKLYPPAGGARN